MRNVEHLLYGGILPSREDRDYDENITIPTAVSQAVLALYSFALLFDNLFAQPPFSSASSLHDMNIKCNCRENGRCQTGL